MAKKIIATIWLFIAIITIFFIPEDVNIKLTYLLVESIIVYILFKIWGKK